jgi:uncharacterized membrane protein YfcA
MALYNLYRMAFARGTVEGTERRRWLPWIGALIGAEVGFSSAGAGVLGSLVLMIFTKLTPSQIVGTDLWFGLVISAIGGVWHAAASDYNPALLWRLVAGGLAGVTVGAKISTAVPPRPLRLLLTMFLFGLGLELAWRSFMGK